jgi:DNA-binding IclR family transcriptional regulator
MDFMVKESNSEKYSVKIVERCLQILDLAADLDRPLTSQDVCRNLKINVNMAFRLLSTLVKTGYLVKDSASGQFAVSLKALRLSRKALLSLEIRKLIMPYLEILWHQYPKANLNMAVYYEGDILVLDRIDSVNLPRTYFTPGKTVPFHCTALGKILSCELSEPELDDLIREKGLKAYTPRTISDAGVFKRELAGVRKEQCARDRNEYIPNDNCNAVPVRNQQGNIVAAISLSAFENYMTVQEVEDTMPVLIETGRKVSYLLGYGSGDMRSI